MKVRERIERDWAFKSFLPLVIMGNRRSLANKTDNLTALINSQHAYRECSLHCFTEAWLNGYILDPPPTLRIRSQPDTPYSHLQATGETTGIQHKDHKDLV